MWAGGAGWVILGFFAALTAFTGEGTNCTANRGDRYQSCVRNGDLTGLIAQAAVVGLAAMAVVVMLRGWGRQREAVLADSRLWVATAVLAGLLVVSGLSWIWGIQGGWAPSRPFPYEPVTTTQANTIMVAGLLVGLLVGALVPLERDHR